LNLTSTIGAFILALGFGVVVWDIIRSKKKQPVCERNPWNAGTLEWMGEMPDKPWGSRSIPEIDSRYPLWDQPNLMRDVDEGRFFLPDAEEGKRETLVTTTVDAQPVQCLRVGGPTWLPLLAAVFAGGSFIAMTFHWWWTTAISGVLAIGVILRWLWTGTAAIPEKREKYVGLGVTLPVYASGSNSVGWWAMLILMLADITAFISLIFGYFFYWTVHPDFPPPNMEGPGVFWPVMGGILLLGAWGATILARRLNRLDRRAGFYAAIFSGVVLAVAGCAALVLAPDRTGLDPTSHAYAAIVCVLLYWAVFHAAVGIVMQLYCLARRYFNRMDGEHDIDICNVALYWHFVALTVGITVAVVAGFPHITN